MDLETPIRVAGLGKTYRGRPFKPGFRALEDVSVQVGRGSVFGLVGPNGAGKTTLIKILLGLVRGFQGSASLFGERVGSVASRQRIGYLPEAHRLPTYLTGRQVLQLFGQMCGRSTAYLSQRIPAMLELVDMTKDADRKLREYSKGMQQRIALAHALIHEPELIFLDEPTDGVDPIGRAAIRQAVRDLKQKGMTIFINSHLLMEVEMIADRIVIMHKGRILKEATTEELTSNTETVRFKLDRLPENVEGLLAGIGEGFCLRDGGFELLLVDQDIDQVVDRLRASGYGIRGLVRHRLNLEEAFIDLVQGEPK